VVPDQGLCVEVQSSPSHKKMKRKIHFGENVEGYSVPVLNEREDKSICRNIF